MKKLAISVLFSFLFSSIIAQNGSQQIPPYKRFPSLPPMKLLLIDSTTWFTTENVPSKTATMVMLFDPDCEHCQKETQDIINQIDKFKNITIIMATPLAFGKIKEFYNRYNLNRFKNIIVGRDVSFTLPVFYNVSNLPLLAFYTKKGKLIDTFEGNLSIAKILGKFKE